MSEQASPIVQETEKSANEMYGYRTCMSIEGAIRKCLSPISENARNRSWMAQDLSVYSNTELVYAILPISIALSWGKGGRRIVESETMPMIFTILTHCVNTTATNNYSVRTKGQRFCADTMLTGSSPLAPLGDWGKSKDGDNPDFPGKSSENVLSAFACVVLGDFEVRKDDLRGDGRSREIVFVGKSAD